MKSSFNHSNDADIYPGCFIPSEKEAVMKEKIKGSYRNHIKMPMVNIISTKNHFKIEFAIPGVNKEDFHIETKKNKIKVMVFHEADRKKQAEFSLHEFDHEFYEREIYLPDEADLSFITAVYEHGILNIHVPKSEKTGNVISSRIFVY